MEDALSPLVLTKLRVPAVRRRTISRPHLVDLLSPGDGARLVLVCAPAGYGKTTLLAEWAQSLVANGTAVAWIALDPGDDDPIPFRSYVIASFIQALGPVPELAHIAQLLRSSPEIDLQQVLPAVINAVLSSGRECVLILDDYHLIGSPAIHSALVYLLEHLPQNLRLAIGSRSDPPLPLARLRARGQLLELRTSGLRFQADETARFLNDVMQLGLSPAAVAALDERTEGWVAGLQLAALSLSGRDDKERFIASFSGGHRYLVEYLLDEVVSRQPQEVRSFLLATSVLERMCAPLCDAITGSRESGVESSGGSLLSLDSRPILEYLEKSNLFLVPIDDGGTWYRYHHLFRDFLRTRLGKDHPERIDALHRAACEWLAAENFLRQAAYHAFQTQDPEYAAAFVEQHSFTLIIHSDIATIYEWCSALPEDVLQARPMLCILQGLALAYSFRRQNRARVEARLRQADEMIARLEDRQAAREMLEFAAVARTFMAFAPDPAADPAELLATAERMADSYPEGDPGQFSGLLLKGYAHLALQNVRPAAQVLEEARQIARCAGLYFGIIESTFHLARLAHDQAELDRAVELCRQGQADIAAALARPERELPALGCLDVELGRVLLEGDRLDEAGGSLRRGLVLMGGGMNPYYLMTAYVALFRLYEVQDRPGDALRYLERLEAGWPDVAFLTQGLRLRHTLRQAPGDPRAKAEAAAWCQGLAASVGDGEFLPGSGPFGAAEAYYLAYLAWAQIQIELGNPQAALACLQKQLEQAAANGLVGRVIELSALAALAWRAAGDSQRAWAALERALSAGMAAAYVRTFDRGPEFAKLLVEAAQRGIRREYIERILRSTGHGGTAPQNARTPFGESLSERELEVLRLMAQGATNREIAERLVVTVGTVKSHINHILGKLDSHNRTEAVARARALGLLEI